MAVVAGTVQRYDRKGLRESLSDRISNVDPQDTPAVSMFGTGPRAQQTLEEWQTDTFRDPAQNAAVDGDEASFSTPSATVRVGNFTQILTETARVSGTVEAIRKAGRRSEMSYQIMKRGVEMRLDLEWSVVNPQAPDPGDGVSQPRLLASLHCWLKSNTDFDSTSGADPTYTAGIPDLRVDSSMTRIFAESIGQGLMQTGYNNGARFKVLMVAPGNKTYVSNNWIGIVTRNFDISNVDPRPSAAIASIDVYVSDFGTLRIIPNRVQRLRDAWFLDPEFAHLRYLRPFRTQNLAITGDSTQKQIIAEVTLAVMNEQGLGGAFDLQ